MKLCGDDLPWVTNVKHLGNYLEDKIDGLKKDVKMKRAQFINKNNELIQEFKFQHPRVIFGLNKTYNSHFTGSPLWDLSGREVEMLENSWNTSVRLMFDLPRTTHTRFIEGISDCSHLRKILASRFLSFTQSLMKSSKQIVRNLYDTICRDVQSVTGKNLRHILLQVYKDDISDLVKCDAEYLIYRAADDDDRNKIKMILELVDVKNDVLNLENLLAEEVDDILVVLCSD